jgi:hypothetical protein
MSHSYQTYFGFPESDLNLDCRLRDHVITRFASLGPPKLILTKPICTNSRSYSTMPYNYGYSFNNKSPAPIFHIEIDGLN